MEGADPPLARREVAVLGAVTATVILAGVVLYAAGYNEAFVSGNDGVRAVFEALTELGNEKLYLVVLTLIYLSYDKRMGRRMCLVFFLIVYVTDVLKHLVQDPRPPSNAERDEPVSGYGFPSGHTTTSVTFYGYILLSQEGRSRYRHPLTVVCLFAMVAVPVSRLVIGAHDVQDVAGGAVVALTVLVAYIVLLPRAAPVLKAWTVERQMAFGMAASLLLWLGAAVLMSVHQSVDAVLALEGTAMGPGLLMGCAIAFPLEEARVGYRPDLMARRQRLVAAAVGIPSVALSYMAMAEITNSVLPEHLAKFLTYALLMLVMAFLVPYVLMRFLPARGPIEDGGG